MKNCTVNHYDMNVDGFNSTLFVLIDLADDIIGSCMLFHDGLIQDFHVVEKFRGVGLGSGLLEKVEEIAKEKKIKLIHGLVQVKNNAMRFWGKKGFSTHPSRGELRISKIII